MNRVRFELKINYQNKLLYIYAVNLAPSANVIYGCLGYTVPPTLGVEKNEELD